MVVEVGLHFAELGFRRLLLPDVHDEEVTVALLKTGALRVFELERELDLAARRLNSLPRAADRGMGVSHVGFDSISRELL